MEYTTRPLAADTWDAFVRLGEKHNGVWGGCWCTWFHPAGQEKVRGADGNRDYKERDRPKGKNQFVMHKVVPPQTPG